MANKKLSDEQIAIVEADIGNILVSAAAGSGKTTVLVRRIIEKILAGEFDVDEILVVTFTKEAAKNMRNKIEDSLREKLSVTEDKEERRRIRRQIDLLPNAYIQTIGSFCARVIKERGYVCADTEYSTLLLSNTAVMDENQKKMILNDAAGMAIDDMYQDSSDEFLILTDMFGNGRTDDKLAETVVRIYSNLRSLPNYINDRCDRLMSAMREEDEKGIVRGLKEFCDGIMVLINRVRPDSVNHMADLARNTIFLRSKNEERREEFCSLLNSVGKYALRIMEAYDRPEPDYTEVFESIKNFEAYFDSSSFPGIKRTEETKEFCDAFGPVAALRLLLHELMNGSRKPNGYGNAALGYELPKEYGSILRTDTEKLLELQKRRTAVLCAFIQILKKMDRYYLRIKSGIHGMDFSDQEQLASLILSDEETKDYYRSKFREIYIDEYQDNSEIQDAIIDSFENSNVFRVGDVKQSIYRFRYANPALFLMRMKEYADASAGSLFNLNCNYRSTPAILDFVNILFEQLLSASASEIEYDRTQRLYSPEGKEHGEPVRVVVTDNRRQDMIAASCEEVKYYLDRDYLPEDICVLTRRRSTAAEISALLRANGINAMYTDNLSIFDDDDIHGIISLIICLGNELRDEYLSGVLLSGYSISNFTLSELAAITAVANSHGADQSTPLINRLRLYLRYADSEADSDTGCENVKLHKRVNRFLDWFGRLRSDCLITDISEVIEKIYSSTGLVAGIENKEKLKVFKDWMCDTFLSFGSDIASVASSLENMKIKLDFRTEVRTNSDKGKAVTCMTYHTSKGLEFPCVIVTDLYTKNSTDDSVLAFDSVNGYSIMDFDEESVGLTSSVMKVMTGQSEKLANNSEDMRLLYVALTRAEKHLSVVAHTCLRKNKKSKNKSVNKTEAFYHQIIREPDKQISRAFWIMNGNSLPNVFFAALLRLSGSAELTGFLTNLFELDDDIRTVIPFDDFELIIRAPDEEPDEEATRTDGDDKSEYDDGREYDDDIVTGDTGETQEKESYIKCIYDEVDEAGMPVFSEYKYDASTRMPFKLTVSALNSVNGRAEEKAPDDSGKSSLIPMGLEIAPYSWFVERLGGDIGDTPAELGTFAHRLFRFIDITKLDDTPESYRRQIEELAREGIIRDCDIDRAMPFDEGIRNLVRSDLGKRMINALRRDKLEQEKPIVFSMPSAIYEDRTDEVLVQGIIDCIFEEDDGFVIIDYKTDRFSDSLTEAERASAAISRHKMQINLYAAAVSASDYKVKEKYLYLVRYSQLVRVS